MSVIYDDHGLDFALKAAPGMGGKRLVKNMQTLGQKFQRVLVGDVLNGMVLRRRTGRGGRSIFYRVVEGSANDVELIVGADLNKAPYMRAQALGAEIRPTHGRYLAIPLNAAKTGNGVARFSAADVKASPSSFGYKSTFVRVGSHGPIIFGVKDGGIVPLFVLKSSVTLPSRNFLRVAKQFLVADIDEAFNDVAQVIVDTATSGAPATPEAQ
jgi:hypothetical protein